ncbi:MAG: cyclic lactone autoinducer peptide [Clostridia bacterium]|nr:cyclic lactone autoinducer peptide [Clostridia bacterium]
MKKFLAKYGHVVATFAFVMTTYVANRNCGYIFHQPKLPETAKRLRKF